MWKIAGEEGNIYLNQRFGLGKWTKDDFLIATTTGMREAFLLRKWEVGSAMSEDEREGWEREASVYQVENMQRVGLLYHAGIEEGSRAGDLMNRLALHGYMGMEGVLENTGSGRALTVSDIWRGKGIEDLRKGVLNVLSIADIGNEEVGKMVEMLKEGKKEEEKERIEVLAKIVNQYRVYSGKSGIATSNNTTETMLLCQFIIREE